VYKEEKNRRAGRKTSNKRNAEELSRPEKRSIGSRPQLPRKVDVIAEDDEETTSTLVSPTSGRVLSMNPLPKRTDTSYSDTNGRIRAISTSQIQTGATRVLARKTSSLSTKVSIPISQKRSVRGPTPLELSDRPNRTRKIQRDITEMDPDDILNGSDDEKSESRTLSGHKTSRPPKISKSARDLIDFLDQGPPEDYGPSLPLQSRNTSPMKSTGRFQRMMSRLTGSSSNEKLREEGAKLRRTPVTNTPFNTINGTMNPPQSPARNGPAVIVATPPPRMQSMTQQATPPSSPPTVNHDSPRPMQRKTSVRKKVPPLDPGLEQTPGRGLRSPVSRTMSNERSSQSALTNGNGQPNGVNEAQKPASPPSPLPEPEPRTRTSADTIASDDKVMFRRPAPTPPKITIEVVTPTPAPTTLPITVRPPSSPQGIELPLNATHAQSLRQLMSMATTADECRVLVDMFLARVGFPIDRSTNVDPYPSPISSTDPSDVDLESSVIETLLGGDSSSGPSTATHSAQPSEVGTSDAETCEEAVDSLTQRSPSRIIRDTRVDRPLPSTTRLLAVA